MCWFIKTLSNKFLLCLVVMAFSLSAAAFEAEDKLPEPQEKIAKEIFSEIRCVVCAGESIADSNAEMAVDMRLLIRSKVASGQSPSQIKAYMADKYGKQILQTPPVEPSTYLLWFLPLVMVIIGAAIIAIRAKKKK
jgi:cytochrome c-type biogenesis protein CcmH